MQIGKTDTSGIGAAARTVQPTATNQAATPQPITNTAANATAGSGGAPVTGGLRTQAPALLTESPSDNTPKLTLATFDALVARKNQELADTLMSALQALKIPTNEPITLRLDGAGRVTADGPYKEKIEKMFEERPELTQQLKDVAGLNAMLALNEAMRRFSAAKKSARDDDERGLAEATYLSDCLNIQARADTMVLAEGKLISPAVATIATR